jgi:hypothetical protein
MPASTVTVKQICDAIHEELGLALVAAGDLTRSQNAAADPQTGEGLTEGINDRNTLQVYWEEETPVSTGGGTQKKTLGSANAAPYIDEEIVILADYFCQQRANIGEDMAKLITGVDAIRANLKTQDRPNPFGLIGIASFQWSGQRVVFVYSGVDYIGARFRLVLRTF